MGQIKIINREWTRESSRFWFELDGAVTIKTTSTTTKDPEEITSKYWLLQKLNKGGIKFKRAGWALQESNKSKTRNHEDSCLNEYPDTPIELFCRFTAQIIDYHKPISFSPHSEQLRWNREPR